MFWNWLTWRSRGQWLRAWGVAALWPGEIWVRHERCSQVFFFSHSESYNSGKAALQSSCQCGMLKGLTWGSRSLRCACGWGSHWRLLLGSPEFQAGVTQNCPGLLAVRTPVHLCLHLLLFQLAGITAVKTSLVARESEIIHLFVAVL